MIRNLLLEFNKKMTFEFFVAREFISQLNKEQLDDLKKEQPIIVDASLMKKYLDPLLEEYYYSKTTEKFELSCYNVLKIKFTALQYLNYIESLLISIDGITNFSLNDETKEIVWKEFGFLKSHKNLMTDFRSEIIGAYPYIEKLAATIS